MTCLQRRLTRRVEKEEIATHEVEEEDEEEEGRRWTECKCDTSADREDGFHLRRPGHNPSFPYYGFGDGTSRLSCRDRWKMALAGGDQTLALGG